MDQDIRQRTRRRDYTREVLRARPAPPTAPIPPEISKKRHKKLSKQLRVAVLIILVIALLAGGIYVHHDSEPIPKNIRQSLDFPVYYPSKLPGGYSLQKNNVKVANGILFYNLVSGNKKIAVTEQAKPAKPPDLSALTKPQVLPGPSGPGPTLPASFESVSSPAGQAIEGKNLGGSPAAIILTASSLISISGSSGLPDSDLSTVLQSLSQLK